MSESCLHRSRARFAIDLHPSTSGNVLKGVREQLSLLLIRYIDNLGGVLLSYNNVTVLSMQATVRPYFPYYQVAVEADVVLFKPAVGSRLSGTVGTIGADYISLLVLGLFNAVLKREALPAHWRCRAAEACWVSSQDRRRLEIGTVLDFAVAQVISDSDMFAISASLMEPGTGISDRQVTAAAVDPAAVAADLIAAAAAVAATAPHAGASEEAPDCSPAAASKPTGDSGRKQSARRPLVTEADPASAMQHGAAQEAADGLRPGKRRKQTPQPAAAAVLASPTAGADAAQPDGQSEPPAAAKLLSKKERRALKAAAAAAAGAGKGDRESTDPAGRAATGASEAALSGADQGPGAAVGAGDAPDKSTKKKKRKHSLVAASALREGTLVAAPHSSTAAAAETAGDTSKRRKKEKSRKSGAAEPAGPAPNGLPNGLSGKSSMLGASSVHAHLSKGKKERKAVE